MLLILIPLLYICVVFLNKPYSDGTNENVYLQSVETEQMNDAVDNDDGDEEDKTVTAFSNSKTKSNGNNDVGKECSLDVSYVLLKIHRQLTE